MRFNLALALSISILLVGGASWFRFSTSEEAATQLIAVERQREADNTYYEEVIAPVLGEDTPNSTASNEPLTSTDLIGRQLISDYIALSSSGQVTDQSLNDLAERYIDSIPTLAVAERVEFRDLQSVANNDANFVKYGEEISKIYSNYVSGLLTIQSSGGVGSFLKGISFEAPQKMATIYRETALQLKNLATPTALIEAHLDLVNIYTQNASAMNYLAEMQKDPASAFAGLLTMNENISKEAELLAKIERVLTANGI